MAGLPGSRTVAEPEIIGAYDAIAPLYREYSKKRQAYLDAVDRLVIDNLEAGSRLLDIGSGDGRRLAKIMQATGLTDVVAVEPSSEMARLCRQATGLEVFRAFGEDIDRLDIGEFDRATALWNIFGHIPGSQQRLQTLVNIRQKLKPGGKLILDVNNRHNAPAYGKWQVFLRLLLDSVDFSESRGDASYQWKIGEQVFNASGHLFTPGEIEKLFAKAGFAVERRCSVNYVDGDVSDSRYLGQLFYVLENPSRPPF